MSSGVHTSCLLVEVDRAKVIHKKNVECDRLPVANTRYYIGTILREIIDVGRSMSDPVDLIR
jgi:hypothetical protein